MDAKENQGKKEGNVSSAFEKAYVWHTARASQL
jgi:hypothetical protein